MWATISSSMWAAERTWPQLTLVAWVRLDRLGAPYQSLLHTDGWNQGPLWPGPLDHHENAPVMRLALFGNTLEPGSESKEGLSRFAHAPCCPSKAAGLHLATVL